MAPLERVALLNMRRGALCAGGASELKTEPARAFDRARSYYSMLMLPADEVLKVAGEKPMRYSAGEWMALLQVSTVNLGA